MLDLVLSYLLYVALIGIRCRRHLGPLERVGEGIVNPLKYTSTVWLILYCCCKGHAQDVGLA
jgi:hypothetical protein